MAVLANGIETLEFGVTDWVTKMNANLALLDNSTDVDSALSGKALATHLHTGIYEVVATTIDQSVIETYLTRVETDLQFTNDTDGISVIDTVAATAARIYIDNGVVLSEVVI